VNWDVARAWLLQIVLIPIRGQTGIPPSSPGVSIHLSPHARDDGVWTRRAMTGMQSRPRHGSVADLLPVNTLRSGRVFGKPPTSGSRRWLATESRRQHAIRINRPGEAHALPRLGAQYPKLCAK
jgi:hypothetical protein